MDESYDWPAFYSALCKHGPGLLSGIDSEVIEVIAMVAQGGDEFWSKDLEPLLAHGATAGDLRAGVVNTLRLWRGNVLQAISDNFGFELDAAAVTIDTDSPLIDELVLAATSPLGVQSRPAERSTHDSGDRYERTAASVTAAHTESGRAERLDTLEFVRRALRRELHTLALRPRLTWQQLHNRLQWAGGPITHHVTAERRRRSRPGASPWVHEYTPLAESAALVRTLTGHTRPRGRVGGLTCSVSPDGAWIVSAGLDDTLRIWDVATGAERATLVGSGSSCAVSPDGTWIVSRASDGLSFRDTSTGLERGLLPEARSPCAVSPDGTWIVSAGSGRELKVWDMASGAELATLTGHTGPVQQIVVSPDGTWIVSASESPVSTWVAPDNKLRIWDVATGVERATLSGHYKAVNGCAISPDGTWIVSASRDKTLKIWDVATGTEVRTLAGHTESVAACAVSPDGTWIVSAGWDRTLRIWDVATGNQRAALTGHTNGVSDCAVSPDGTWIVSAGWDDTLKVWDVDAIAGARAETTDVVGHTRGVSDCVMSPDGTWIVSPSRDSTLRIWDVVTGAERVALIGHTGPVNKCAVSPDGTWIVSAGLSDNFDNTLKIWDVATGTERATLSGRWDPGTEEFERNECAVSPDGTWFVSDSIYGLTIWDVASGTERTTLTGAYGEHAVSPDGSWIVCASSANTLKIWDVQTGANLATLVGHTSWIKACAVSPDGSWVVSAGSDRTLRIWDSATGAELVTLTGHSGAVKACVVSPDGANIVSVDDDYALKVWDVNSGAERATLIGHTADVAGCAVSPDGRWIASASRDKTLRIWHLATGVEQAMFVLPASASPAVFHPFAPTVACGDDGGGVHLVHLVGIDYGPIIVTAVDLGNGPEIRCPYCSRMISWREKHGDQEVACPLQGCGRPLKINQSRA